MLLKLRPGGTFGKEVIEQIVDHIEELVLSDNWSSDIRSPDEIIDELNIVVSNKEFSAILQHHHAFLYVGTVENIPASYVSFYRDQPFKDWIILLKLKDNLFADPVYLFSVKDVAGSPTLH